jgi:SAM-dependent methyltransferase
MHLDVLDLKTFYYKTRLGRAAQKAVRGQMLRLWPEAQRQTVVGFGFAVPLLRPYLDDARRVVALMPGQQGVMPWPPGAPNVSVLCEETLWPLETGRADKLVLLHGLETSENPPALLDECQRVLGPGGRALFIVPNRAGLWARRDRTPFGFGRPFSLTQLETQLVRHGFAPARHAAALFQPPTEQRFWLRTGPFWESAGRRISNRYAGGVLLVEAVKKPPASTGAGLIDPVRRPLRILDPVPQPGGRPA